jgi:hypothetical protein
MVIVGIHGKARSGKTTAANYLINQQGFMRMSFADALKEAANLIFGIPMTELYSDQKSEFTRDVLQKLGTDCCRTLDPQVWVKALDRKIGERYKFKPSSKIIVDDVRFFNEAEMLKDWGAGIIKLKAGHEDDLTTEEQKKHLSEVDMDRVPESFFTAMYINSGTKEELYQFMDTAVYLTTRGAV